MKRTRSRMFQGLTAIALGCTIAATPVVAAPSFATLVDQPIIHSAQDASLSLEPTGTYDTGVFDESAAEIVQYYNERIFVINALAGAVDVLDSSDPTKPTKLFTIASDGTANSVAIREDGLGVIAMENPVKTENGQLVFFDANADEPVILGAVTIGAQPDMVTVSPDGAYAIAANEAEPNDDFTVDPEGSIAVVSLPQTIAAPVQDAVRIADFNEFEEGGSKTLHSDVRIFGPQPHGDDNPVSRNLEPEYVAVADGKAYAALQENNAVAVVDLATATVTDIWPLGFKDHSVHALDPSDRDDGISLRTFEGLYGVYEPDGIEIYEAGGQNYLVTANEGDAREWGDYVEGVRVKDLGDDGLAPVCEDSPLASMTGDADLGRLNVTTEMGLNEAGDCYENLYAFGARSFSIWTTDGQLVFDSGSQFEEIIAETLPEFFNSNHSETNFEGRSDDKGPEPENMTIGTVGDRTYAFIGMERIGGVMVYDITDPVNAKYTTYVNNRDFSVSVEDADDIAAALAQADDLGAEGLDFVSQGPTGSPLVIVGNEVSGTTTIFEATDLLAEEDDETNIQVLTVNDFHGRLEANFGSGEAGAAVMAGAVNQHREENPNTVFVSAGDNIGASTFTSFIAEDTPTIDALVAAGLDLGAVGNHEFDRGFADLTDRVIPRFGSENFALGANVYEKGTDTPALEEYIIQEVDGVNVAFIGTVTQQTAAMVSPDGIADIEFGDQLEAANRVAAELEADNLADVTVLLTHEGSATSECSAVAEDSTVFGDLIRGASEEIDAIVSGHTHQKYNCVVEGRPVIQAHQYGTTLGKLDITVDSESKELLSIEGDLVPLVEEGQPLYEADPEVAAIVADAVEVAEAEGSVQVGKISADILRGGTPPGDDRGVESSMGNLVADMYLWSTTREDYAGTEAVIGVVNPGGLRDDLLYGEDGTVSYRDAANVQPFANTLVTAELTGEQLKAVLEEQWQPEGASRPKLHLGISEGFGYVYDEEAPRGERILSMTLNGEEIDPAASYTVVTNSFLAAGGDNFFTFAEGANTTDSGQIDLQASVEYFEAHEVVDPAPLGRAVLDSDVEPEPTEEPTVTPTEEPTTVPTAEPTTEPTTEPSDSATAEPSSPAATDPAPTESASTDPAPTDPAPTDSTTDPVVAGQGGGLAATGTTTAVIFGSVAILLVLIGTWLLMRARRSQA